MALLLSLAILLPLSLSSVAAATPEVIGVDTSKTVTLTANSHDAYRLLEDSSRTVDVEVTANQPLDFYVMNDTGYNEYVDPSAPSFHTVDFASEESVTSFSYSTLAYKGRILVVDNQNWTSNGSPGSQPVTYTITILFAAPSGGPTPFSIAVAALAGGAVFGSIALVLRRQRKRKQAAITPITATPLPPPPLAAPSSTSFPVSLVSNATVAPAPVSTAQTAGRLARKATPVEFAVLVQDFKMQKGKLLVLPILGIIASLVLQSSDDWTMSPLVLLALFSPLAVAMLRRYRSAIALGNVSEYRGIPTAVSEERIGKKQFYRVLFGTHALSIQPSLYGRLVPSQENTLAIFEQFKGRTLAISVNGTSLPAPLNETVIQVGPSPIAAGIGAATVGSGGM